MPAETTRLPWRAQRQPRIVPRPARGADAAVSFAQERLWFVMQLAPWTSAYTVAFARRLRGPLAVDRLRAALRAVVARYECLRTTFPTGPDGQPRQRISADPTVEVPVVDLSNVPTSERFREALRLIDEQQAQPMDLVTGPLVRSSLIRLDRLDHVFLVTMHHLVTDLWSLGLFEQELAEVYSALDAGRSPALPEIGLQYADFSEWQRERYGSGALDRQLAYWRDELADLEPLELPADRPRPSEQSFDGDSVDVDLGAGPCGALRALCEQERVTPFMVVLGAFAVLLGKYTGRTDVPVGFATAGRSPSEVRLMQGFFANTLVIRTDLAGSPTFLDVVRAVRHKALNAYANQEIPFAKLVSKLEPARDFSRTPLCQVMFQLDVDPAERPRWAGLEATALRRDRATTCRFDLELQARLEPDALRASLTYATSLFDRSAMQRMARRFGALTERLLADPTAPVDSVSLLDDAEREIILRQSCGTASPCPDTTVHALVEAQAARTPNRTAVVAGTNSLSYAELNERADRLAGRLREHGAGVGTVVGVLLDRSPDLLVGLLAVLKSGGAYLPLDPIYPADRLRRLLAETGAAVLLTCRAMGRQLGHVPTRVRVLALDDEATAVGHSRARRPGATADDLAYVMYTSGSTGGPKGVAIPHLGIVRLLAGAHEYLRVDPTLTTLQLSPPTFDASTIEIWAPLVAGGRVVLGDPGRLLEHVPELVTRHGITTLGLISPQFSLLLDRDPQVFASLREVIVGGDAVPRHHFRRFRELFPACKLIAGYGPTENTLFSTVYPADELVDRAATVPIGRPIANSSAYILDRALGLVPFGLTGEICVAGKGLARGYLGRPALTAERFLPDPYGPSGSRLYRTGDLGRLLDGGRIEFLGRTDAQVKIRGYRVETGEIESTLLQHEHVRQAVVLPYGDGASKALAAYVVAVGDVPVHELRGFLRRRLPEYMVPSVFVPLDAIPLTANNKVDRRALPDPRRVPRSASTAKPATPLEATLAAIWSELLGVEDIGMDDGFFDLGGHSLLAVSAIARVREALGVELPLRLLLDAPVLRDFAAAVAELIGGQPASSPTRAPLRWRGRHGGLAGRLVSDGRHRDAQCVTRRVDLYLPPAGLAVALPGLLVVFDGAMFVEIARAPAIVDELVSSRAIPPVAAVFLDSPEAEAEARSRELLGDQRFLAYVSDELLPWAQRRLGASRSAVDTVVAGASAGAVAAVLAGLTRPDRFGNVIGQSGPYWQAGLAGGRWPEARRGDATVEPAPGGTRFYLSAGTAEQDDPVPERAGIPEATRALARTLRARGYDVRLDMFDGGHDAASWQQNLGDALLSLLGTAAT